MTLSTERLCNELEQWLASTSFMSFTTTSLVDPMLRTNSRRLHGPFPPPCNSSVQSAAGRRAAGIADTLVRDRRRRGQLSRLYKRKRLLFLAQWPARHGRAAGQHRFAVALAFAACARESLPL